MRVISGIKKGCKLIEFDGDDIRPTTDRVKESVFNLIQEYVREATVLDLFAGSGGLCFEAVSRGAKSGICIDADSRSVEVIKKNRQKLGFEDVVKIYHTRAEEFLKSDSAQYDIVFIDPPYNKGFIEPVLSLIVSNKKLSDIGIIVIESDNPDKLPEIAGLSILKQRRYGRTTITVYAKNL